MTALTEAEANMLKAYADPATYSIFWTGRERETARALEGRGLLAWVPEMFGGISWSISEEGREVLATLTGSAP